MKLTRLLLYLLKDLKQRPIEKNSVVDCPLLDYHIFLRNNRVKKSASD